MLLLRNFFVFSEEPTIFNSFVNHKFIEPLGCLVFPSKNCYNYFLKSA